MLMERGINDDDLLKIFYYAFVFQKRKMLGDSSSTQVLRDLEISLRTNHIE